MVKQILVGLSILGILSTRVLPGIASTELEVVESAALGTRSSPPWSEPVQINDPFEGDFIGVFDRNSFFGQILNTRARIEIQSLWIPEEARFLLTTRDRNCLSGTLHGSLAIRPSCSNFNDARNLITLFLRIGDDVFQVEGENSVFPVSPALAEALQNAPEGDVDIRLVSASGETVDSEIGEETVEAWKTVYDAAQTLPLD
ncbi:MAG: hypothetical protein F6K30_17630 [Cyanothece sp. SIO2G6]|nr:hypothetical protein [Cyanothece sp. SIO2G6]